MKKIASTYRARFKQIIKVTYSCLQPYFFWINIYKMLFTPVLDKTLPSDPALLGSQATLIWMTARCAAAKPHTYIQKLFGGVVWGVKMMSFTHCSKKQTLLLVTFLDC